MFTHHGPAGPLAMLLIHGMWVYGAVVAAFGFWCIGKGIREFITKFRRFK